MNHYHIQVRKADPQHRIRSNDGWEGVADVRGTEAQAQEALTDYQTRNTSGDEFRLVPVRPTTINTSGAP